MRYFVFSDAHGFYNELIKALQEAGFDENDKNHMLISCGDNFDRGPDNVKMYNFLRKMKNKNKIILIRGNHEDLLLECIERGQCYGHDIHNGTAESIRQFAEMARGFKVSNSLMNWDFKALCDDIVDKSKLVNFINDEFVDFFETKLYVFTHGFVPLKDKPEDEQETSPNYVTFPDKMLDPNWRIARDIHWNEARWLNGMEEVVLNKNFIPGKIAVVGHFHASWGNVRAKYGWKLKKETARQYEFYDISEDYFKPFRAPGIIAIDACTAFTNKVNVLVVDDDPVDVNCRPQSWKTSIGV